MIDTDRFLYLTKINLESVTNENENFIKSLEPFILYHSNNCSKHFLGVLTIVIIETINDILKEGDLFESIVYKYVNGILPKYEVLTDKINNIIIENFITSDVNIKLKNVKNKEHIKKYKDIYIKYWETYVSMIKLGLKMIFVSFFNNVCSNKYDVRKFIYVLTIAVTDFTYIKTNKSPTNTIRNKIIKSLNIPEFNDVTINKNYKEMILDHLNDSSNLLLSDNNVRLVDFTYEYLSKIILTFFGGESNLNGNIIIGKMLNRITFLNEFIQLNDIIYKIYNKLDHIETVLTNYNMHIISTTENYNDIFFEFNDENIHFNKLQYIQKNKLLYIIREKYNISYKLYGKYSYYKNIKNIVCVTDNKIDHNQNVYYYILGIYQSRINELIKILRLFNVNINRCTCIYNLNKSELNKVKIIKCILSNKNVLFFIDCFDYISSDYKEIILDYLSNSNKTIVISIQ